MTERHGPIFMFSDFIFDPATGDLTKNGHRIRIGKQVSDLLAILLTHSGELVTREQIREVLWPQREQLDFEKVINNGISRLRFLLQDDPKNPRYIERIPKRGYRLIIPVERLSRPRSDAEALGPTAHPRLPREESEATVGADEIRYLEVDASADPRRGRSLSAFWPRKHWGLSIIFASLTFLALAAWAAFLLRPHQTATPDQTAPVVISLEVTPIEYDTPDLKGLASSFQLELVDALSQLPNLKVKEQHTLSKPAGGPAFPVDKNGLATILYGRLSRPLDKCHLEFELVRASDGTHLASFQYNGSESEFASIREKFQQDIFVRLNLARQHGLQAPAGTSNQEAYNEYLQARLHFWQQTNDSMQAAVREFRSAIAKDNKFAAAYAGLGRTLFVMGEHGLLPQPEAIAQASDAITIALRLDPSSAEVHGVLGLIHSYRDWDLAAGERELRLAIRLDPTQAIYHQWLAVVLSIEGKGDEALQQIDFAHADAPDWPPVYTSEVFVAGNAGNQKRLLAAARQLEILTANSLFAKDAMANALWYSGRPIEAIAEWREMAEAEHDQVRVDIENQGLRRFQQGGVKAYAQVRLTAIASGKGTRSHPNDFNPIEWYATAGNKKKAIALLRDLAANRNPDFLENIQSPGLIGLHAENGFKALLIQEGIVLSHI